MKQHSTDNTIPTAADDAVDEADSAVAASKTTDETTAKTTDKISSKTTNDTLPLPCDSAVPRLSRIALPVCSAIGVALAEHGARPWQVAATAPIIAAAFVESVQPTDDASSAVS